MRYYLFPGSFKPPHKGHVKILIDLIKKQKNKDFKIIIIISKKSRKLNNNKRKVITAKQSLKIFKIYIKEINEKFRLKNNISVFVSKKTSPLIDIYDILRKLNKKSNKVFLIKSKKDKNNKRFQMFNRIKTIKILPMKEIKDIHSTNFRKYINKKNLIMINKYLSNKLKEINRKKILEILKI